MHDRHQSGQEPTVVVDDPSDAGLPIEKLADDVPLNDVETCGCAPEATDPGEFDEEPPADEPENVFARRAKLIALLVATAALVASVVVAATIAGDSDEPTDSGDAAPPVREHRITGVAALGGFAAPSPSSSTDRDGPGETEGDIVHAADTSEESSPATRRTAAAVEPASAASPGTSTDRDTPSATTNPDVVEARSQATTPLPEDRAELVRDFYSRVSSSPEAALESVAADLVADEREHLLSAWRSMTVTVEHVHQVSDGSVHVVATLQPVHGKPLRITQILSFSDGPQPIINHATLLSIRAL